MKRTLYIAYILVLVFFLGACRSSRHVSEVFSTDTLSQSSKMSVDATSAEESHTTETDSSEVFVWTITTEYDTSKTDSNGISPLLKTTKTLTIKRTSKKKEKETSKKENISATKEESANQVRTTSKKRESTKAETKQPLYYAYILGGVALVILMAILAYWVFTKYRAARPHE